MLPGYFELAIGLVVCALLAAVAACAATHSLFAVLGVIAARAATVALRASGRIASSTTTRSSSTRNFYGVLRVQDIGTDDANDATAR